MSIGRHCVWKFESIQDSHNRETRGTGERDCFEEEDGDAAAPVFEGVCSGVAGDSEKLAAVPEIYIICFVLRTLVLSELLLLLQSHGQ